MKKMGRDKPMCFSIRILIFLIVMLTGILPKNSGNCFQNMPLQLFPGIRSDAFRLSRIPPERDIAQGSFLVAARKLRDPNFAQTVVFLIQYDKTGAMGVVINRPTEVKLSAVLTDLKALQKRSDKIFWGGPVENNQLLLLFRSDAQPKESMQVFQDVFLGSSPKVIEQMLKNETGENRFRVFAGYAGWAPGQLDQEAARGDWHILPAAADTIFNQKPAEIWPELIIRGSAKHVKNKNFSYPESQSTIKSKIRLTPICRLRQPPEKHH
jgi:putative transcriptional regulator